MFVVGSARGPDRPSQRGVAHGFGLTPVSVSEASVQVRGGVEQKEVKQEPHGVLMQCFWGMRAEVVRLSMF